MPRHVVAGSCPAAEHYGSSQLAAAPDCRRNFARLGAACATGPHLPPPSQLGVKFALSHLRSAYDTELLQKSSITPNLRIELVGQRAMARRYADVSR